MPISAVEMPILSQCRICGLVQWIATQIGSSAFGIDPLTQGIDPAAQGIDPTTEGIDTFYQGIDPLNEGIDPAVWGIDPLGRGNDPIGLGLHPTTYKSNPECISKIENPSIHQITPFSTQASLHFTLKSSARLYP